MRQDSIASCAAASSIPSTRESTSYTYSIIIHCHRHLLLFLIFVESIKLLLAGMNTTLNQFLFIALVSTTTIQSALPFALQGCLLESLFHRRPNTPPRMRNCIPPSLHPLPFLNDVKKQNNVLVPSIHLCFQFLFETTVHFYRDCTIFGRITGEGHCPLSVRRLPHAYRH